MAILLHSPLALLIAQFVVIAVARLLGLLARRAQQPTVVAEMIAGIVLAASHRRRPHRGRLTRRLHRHDVVRRLPSEHHDTTSPPRLAVAACTTDAAVRAQI